jgi:hypothetical protein
VEGTPPLLICIPKSVRSYRASPRQGVVPREYCMEEHGGQGLQTPRAAVPACHQNKCVARSRGEEPALNRRPNCLQSRFRALDICWLSSANTSSSLSLLISVSEVLLTVWKLSGAQKLERLRDQHHAARSSNCIAPVLHTLGPRARGSVRRLDTTDITSRYGSLCRPQARM